MSEDRKLRERIQRQVERIQKADRARPTLLAQSAYIGTLGLLFVLPVVAGAYLGSWLDSRLEGFAVHWTVSLIVVGVAVGGINVYLYVRD